MRGLIIIVLAISAVIWGYRSCGPLGSYESRVTDNFNRELRNPGNPIRRFVERAHLTTTVRSAKVEKCNAETIDGSWDPGEKLENLASVKLLIRTRWDGIFHKNGYSVCELFYRFEKGEPTLTSARIVDTDAMIKDGEAWLAVGLAGVILLSQ